MNRRERRQLERQGKTPKKEPTYTMTLSEIRDSILSDSNVKKILDEEFRKMRLKVIEDCSLDTDTATLWALHRCEGWGKTRLRRLYAELFEEHRRMRRYYEMQDMFPERQKLKEIGVDVEEWFNEECDKEAASNDRKN